MSKIFPCDRCGMCCCNLKKSPLYQDLDRGDGVCLHFNEQTRLCRIYSHRPKKCNVEGMYRYFSNQMSWEEYVQLNRIECKKMQTQNKKPS